jgi:hypothetical protein
MSDPTIGDVIRSPVIPADARASASPIVAQDAPMAPADISRRAIIGHLCDFACGRRAIPAAAACAAMVRML